jgi:hypothetical protein
VRRRRMLVGRSAVAAVMLLLRVLHVLRVVAAVVRRERRRGIGRRVGRGRRIPRAGVWCMVCVRWWRVRGRMEMVRRQR